MLKLDFPILFISLLIPFIGSFLFLILDGKVKDRTHSFVSFFLLIGPVITASFVLFRYGLAEPIVEPPLFSHRDLGSFSMYLDRLNGLYFLGVGIVTPMVAIYSHNYMKYRLTSMKNKGTEVPSLGMFYFSYTILSAAMLGFLITTNLILQYIFLNITVMTSFLLILLYGHGNKERTANMYLIWSMIGGSIFLLGILGLGLHVGTFDLVDIESLELNLGMGQGLPLLIPFFIFFGMCIKKALFGVHVWLPHAHAEAPAPVSALLSPNLITIDRP